MLMYLRLCVYYLMLLSLLPFSSRAFGAAINFEGQLRAQTSYFNKLGLQPNTNKTYNEIRGLLEPNVIIDDHFRIKSQWNLITSPGLGGATPGMRTPTGNQPLGVGQGGYLLGDRNSAVLFLSRAWLEWTSDFGVFRVGRMPVAWGFGLLYDDGGGLWDDFATTFDRLEYRLHLGYVVGGIAVSEPRRSSLLSGGNDSTFYAAYLQYDNPESQIEAGILYEKQARASSQQDELLNRNFPNQPDQSQEIGLPPGTALTPYPLDNSVVDAYIKKKIRYLSFGGEITWLTGKSADYNADGNPDDLNAFGILTTASYDFHSIKAFIEFLYASGDSNLGSGQLGGFVLLHRNRHPGLILGGELLGGLHGNHARLGSLVAYGNAGSYSGALYFRPGFRVDWSKDWSSGVEVIVARKAQVQAGESKNLGVEIDLGLEHAVYKNAVAGLDLGFLVAGDGLGVSGPHGPFAFRIKLGIDF